MRGGEVRLSDSVHVPSVYCPFAPRISPHAADAERYAVKWATRRGLLRTAAAQRRFAAARFAHLMARTYPEANRADLGLATAWLTVVFHLDDYLEGALGQQPAVLRQVADALLMFLAGWPRIAEPPPAARDVLGSALCASLVDVWRRTATRLGSTWRDRFTGHVGEYLAGNVWEAGNRMAGRVPTVHEYVDMRRHSAATEMFFDLIEVYRGAELPGAVWQEPAFRALRRHADNAVAWFNDLVSWPKELSCGETHNLVLVMRHRRQLPISDAVQVVADYCDREVRAFVAERAALPQAYTELPSVIGVISDLANWIRGNADWSQESGRYAPPLLVQG